ncbi:glycosyltransferase [bacterium]|nr:glycosyltransferase [bacterium]
MTKPKVAIATEWLTQYGGAEKTVEAIMELYPNAPIYTAKYDPKSMPDHINKRKIIAPKSSWIRKITKYFFFFLMAPLFEEMDFREYDIVISSGTTWPKGIITRPDQLHISYIHTPPRFLYGYSTESTKRNKWYFKLFFSYVDNMVRLWDYVAAQRPDFLVTNSKETQSRIKKFYRRDATIIYPPVEVSYGNTPLSQETKNKYNLDKPYFMALGRLAAYKNFDLLIKVFNELDIPLVICGRGTHEKTLKRLAGNNIIFVGHAPDKEKHELVSGSLGLINTVDDEDFGIVPIEAQAHGKPVLAYKAGGHLETVKENVSGMFFEELTVQNLKNSVLEFEKKIKEGLFDAEKIKQSVQHFSKDRFQKDFGTFVEQKWNA